MLSTLIPRAVPMSSSLYVSWLCSLRTTVSGVLLSLFGYILPSLCSAKAVISNNEDDLKEWLTYWSVFSFFILFESIFDFILWKIPFYYELKVVLVCWLTLPRTQGAYQLYTRIIEPFFEKYEADIDQKIDDVSQDIRRRSMKHIQVVLWNIILGSSDSSDFFRPVSQVIGMDLFGSLAGIVESSDPQHVINAKPAIIAAEQSLLSDYISCLQESSIALRICTLTVHSLGIPEHQAVFLDYQCRIHREVFLVAFLINENHISNDGNVDNVPPQCLSIPLYNISSVHLEDSETNVSSDKSIMVLELFVPTQLYRAIHVLINVDNTSQSDSRASVKDGAAIVNCFQIITSRARTVMLKCLRLLALHEERIKLLSLRRAFRIMCSQVG